MGNPEERDYKMELTQEEQRHRTTQEELGRAKESRVRWKLAFWAITDAIQYDKKNPLADEQRPWR